MLLLDIWANYPLWGWGGWERISAFKILLLQSLPKDHGHRWRLKYRLISKWKSALHNCLVQCSHYCCKPPDPVCPENHKQYLRQGTILESKNLLYVEVSPTKSSWYHSIFCTSSGSFPACDMTFDLPASMSTRLGQNLFLALILIRWLAHKMVPPCGPCESRLGQQMLASKLLSKVWLQEGSQIY